MTRRNCQLGSTRLRRVNAVTIRRMIVFGVCTLGVAALYIVPSVAGIAQPGRHAADRRTSRRPDVRSRAASACRRPAPPGSVSRSTRRCPPAPAAPGAPADEPEPAEEPTRAAARPTDRGRTAFDPHDAPDSEPPAAVTTISPAKVTADELSLSWPAATDNRRVIGYRIWLNGYEVATTAETRATLRWFNDDEGQHVVQIKAIDAAGNQSACLVDAAGHPAVAGADRDAAADDHSADPRAPTPGAGADRVAQRGAGRAEPTDARPTRKPAPSPPPPASDLRSLAPRRARWSSSPTAPCCSRSTIRPPTRAGSPSRRSPSWSGRRSTSTPTGSPRSGCGTPGPPATTPSRSSTPCSPTAATRCPTACWSTSPRRWTATAGCGSRSTRPTGWSWSPPTGRC